MEKTRKMDNLSNMNKKRIKLGKSVKMLCMLIAVFIVSFIGIDSVLITNAASAGVYTTTTIPSYKHPVTGEVEDSGNNEGIGQPMTESVVNNTSLIEVDADANTYVTVRYFLMDNLSDIKFWVQEDSNSSFSSVSYEVMQENVGGEYCSDFRFKIPSESAIVKTSFYVEPMGREVIFFISFSGLIEGSGDFITTIDTTTDKSSEESNTIENDITEDIENTVEINNVGSSERVSNTATTVGNSTTPTSTTKNVATATTSKTPAEELLDSALGLTLSDATILSDALENGEEESKEEEKEEIVALPWALVWQVILIMTIPATVIGSIIFGGLILLKRMEEE